MAKLGLLAGLATSAESERRQNQKYLLILSIFCALLSIALCIGAAYTSWLADDIGPTIAFTVLSAAVVVVTVCGVIGASKENYALMYTFLYGVVALVPVLLMVSAACFAFHDSIDVYVRHIWERSESIHMRRQFCPDGTINAECRAPIDGGKNYNSTLQWCMAGCPSDDNSELHCDVGSTDCDTIVNDAQHDAENALYLALSLLGSGGLLAVVLLCIGCLVTVRLITVPIVMQNMLTIVNCQSLLPVITCLLGGIWASRNSVLVGGLDAIAIALLAIGSALALFSVLGTIAGRKKHRTGLMIYMIGLMTTLVVCLAVCVACWVYADNLGTKYEHKSHQDVQDIACDANFVGCCCCGSDSSTEKCPEWSKHDVMAIVATNLQVLGCIAFFSLFFVLLGFLGGCAWYKSLEDYQSEEV